MGLTEHKTSVAPTVVEMVVVPQEKILDIHDQEAIDFAAKKMVGDMLPQESDGKDSSADGEAIAVCGAGPYALAATIRSIDDLTETKGGRKFKESGQTALTCLPWDIAAQYIDFEALAGGEDQAVIRAAAEEIFHTVPVTIAWPVREEQIPGMAEALGLYENVLWDRHISDEETIHTIAIPTLAYKGLRSLTETVWGKYGVATFVTSANKPGEKVCTTAAQVHDTFPDLTVLMDQEVDDISRGQWGSYSVADISQLAQGMVYGIRQSQLDIRVLAERLSILLEKPIDFAPIEQDPFSEASRGGKPMKIEQSKPHFSSWQSLVETGVFGR